MEQRIERQMNKTALVTLWVDPAEHQIVKYTFDNVWMDFLPGGWLVKVDDIRASMTMGQPFPGVWLPREMNIHAGVTMAMGSLEAAYARRFSDYKQADVKSLIRIPKAPAPPPRRRRRDRRRSTTSRTATPQSGPFVPERDPQAEVIAEIRVHGNAYVRDDEVIRLAGISLGQPLPADGLRDIEQRLKASGHFDTVEVRKRYRSLDSSTDVALDSPRPRACRASRRKPIDERPSAFGWARLKSRLMFLPILGYDDGYGFTYGGRVSTIGLLGARRAAVGAADLGRDAPRGGRGRTHVHVRPAHAASSRPSASRSARTRTSSSTISASSGRRAPNGASPASSARASTRRRAPSSSARLDDRLWTVGANVALDTRGDPAFPRNAVHARRRLDRRCTSAASTTPSTSTRPRRAAISGVIRQAVLAGRVQYSSADRTLPDYERLLLGGASNLRGFRTGTFDGDRMFVTSAELRVPITSVLSGAKLGLTAFMDAGKAFNVGQSMKDAAWHQGVGGGVFLIATIVRINLDVAHGLKDGDTRVHLSSGFSF